MIKSSTSNHHNSNFRVKKKNEKRHIPPFCPPINAEHLQQIWKNQFFSHHFVYDSEAVLLCLKELAHDAELYEKFRKALESDKLSSSRGVGLKLLLMHSSRFLHSGYSAAVTLKVVVDLLYFQLNPEKYLSFIHERGSVI